jgi:hypothetical protein
VFVTELDRVPHSCIYDSHEIKEWARDTCSIEIYPQPPDISVWERVHHVAEKDVESLSLCSCALDCAKQDKRIVISPAPGLETVLRLRDDIVGSCPFTKAPIEEESENFEKTAFQPNQAITFRVVDRPALLQDANKQGHKPLLGRIDGLQTGVEEFNEGFIRDGQDFGVRYVVDAISAPVRFVLEFLFQGYDVFDGNWT